MFRLLKSIVFLLVFSIFGWVGWSSYMYFFDTSLPQVSVVGLNTASYCCGDVQCMLLSDKKCKVSIQLDGQLLNSHEELCKPDQECQFTIPTRTISNGKHILKVSAVDSTYRKNKTCYECDFYVDNTPLQAAFVKPDSDYKVLQGRTLHVQFQVNKAIKEAKVKALAQDWECYAESSSSLIYQCPIPITCEEQPNEYLFTVELTDCVGNTLTLDNKFQVVFFPFKKERLNVSPEKVKEERELGLADDLEIKLEDIAKNSLPEKLWRGTFCPPIDIERITCEYGTVRTTQEKGRYIHKALDLINAPKSVVWAPQNGVVVLKERFPLNGNTIVIDHGYGVISMLCHLDSFANIEVGQKVVKGNPVGTIGKTGYATGYHLHWEQRIKNIAVDPIQWTKATF